MAWKTRSGGAAINISAVTVLLSGVTCAVAIWFYLREAIVSPFSTNDRSQPRTAPQPMPCPLAWSALPANPVWVSFNCVPPACDSSSHTTSVEPGIQFDIHEYASRLGGLTSRNSPWTETSPPIVLDCPEH